MRKAHTSAPLSRSLRPSRMRSSSTQSSGPRRRRSVRLRAPDAITLLRETDAMSSTLSDRDGVTIWTIGHSTRSFDEFLPLLTTNRIEFLAGSKTQEHRLTPFARVHGVQVTYAGPRKAA